MKYEFILVTEFAGNVFYDENDKFVNEPSVIAPMNKGVIDLDLKTVEGIKKAEEFCCDKVNKVFKPEIAIQNVCRDLSTNSNPGRFWRSFYGSHESRFGSLIWNLWLRDIKEE